MGTLNVRNDNKEINAEEKFGKDAELRKELILQRKRTEISIDTYNTRMMNSIKEVLQNEFTGKSFGCSITIYDKSTDISILLSASYQLSTTIKSNILLLNNKTVINTIKVALKMLVDKGNSFKNSEGLSLNANYAEDNNTKPIINLFLETRTKYF